MPQLQSAQVANYDFGAPNVAGAPGDVVLRFTLQRGGKLDFSFANPVGDADFLASVEVSADGVTYAATTVANNTLAITNASIRRKHAALGFSISLRANLDRFLRIRASGGARGEVQIRDQGCGLDIQSI